MRDFASDDIAAGRRYVRAYVDFVHYVEGLHAALIGAPHGHFLDSSHQDEQ
jgi:hypothetical protein